MFLVIGLALTSLSAQAGDPPADYTACCAALGVSGCPSSIEVVGPNTTTTRIGDDVLVRGPYLLTCEDGAGWMPATRRISSGVVNAGSPVARLDPRVASCFSSACSMPVNLCLEEGSSGVRAVDCRTGNPADATVWMSPDLDNRSPAIVGGRAIAVHIASAPSGSPSTALITTSPPPAAAPPASTPAYVASPPRTASPASPASPASTAPVPPPATTQPTPAVVATPRPSSGSSTASPWAAPAPTSSSTPAPRPAATGAFASFVLPALPPSPCVPDPALREPSLAQADLGDEAMILSDAQSALGHWRAAVTINVCNAPAWANIGSALLDHGRPDAGEQALAAATRIAPKSARSWSELGRAEEALGAWEKAVEAYQDALLLQPELRSAVDGLRRAGREATAR
jgi:hypothetical protein